MLESDLSRMPIVDAMIRHVKSNPLPMHVPGHKMGRGFPSALGQWFENALKIDLTEIDKLDDLHHPTGAIMEAQQLAAQTFGADATFFLVNGSTSGNYAMVFAACKAQERIIIARNMHKSVIQACMMRNLRPIFVDLPIDPFTQSSGPVTISLVRQAIDQYPDAKAVLITSPTYQGVFSPIQELADLVHDAGILLLVDEAHGAHLSFHPTLRKHAALQQGADIVIQSTHKMLGSLTQTAMLHVKGTRVDYNQVQQYVSYFQSSSPSYLFLASLDAVRCQMAMHGERLLVDALERWNELYHVAESWHNIQVAPIEDQRDPFKICLRFTMISTEQAQCWLREQHKIHLEMITPSHALAVATYADTASVVRRFIHALSELDQWIERNREVSKSVHVENNCEKPFPTGRKVSQPEIEYQSLEALEAEWVPTAQAIGRIVKYAVIPYPPGIPILCPGERVHKQELEYVMQHMQNNGNVQGVQNGAVAVVKEKR